MPQRKFKPKKKATEQPLENKLLERLSNIKGKGSKLSRQDIILIRQTVEKIALKDKAKAQAILKSFNLPPLRKARE